MGYLEAGKKALFSGIKPPFYWNFYYIFSQFYRDLNPPALVVNLGPLQRDVGISGKERGIVEVEPVLEQHIVLVHGGQRDPYDSRGKFPALWTLGLLDGIAHHRAHALGGACGGKQEGIESIVKLGMGIFWAGLSQFRRPF